MYLIAKPSEDNTQPYVSWCGGNWWSGNWIDAVLFPGPEAAQRQVQALGLTEYMIHISPHQTTRVGRDGNLEGLVVSIEENERLRNAHKICLCGLRGDIDTEDAAEISVRVASGADVDWSAYSPATKAAIETSN